MPDTSVKVFRSTDSGAPSLTTAAGSLIGVLDACLVNGYGAVTVTPLVVAGGVATGTVSAGHGFTMLGSTGPVISIAGATPSGLNGVWRLASVPSSTTFTFAVSGISDQTATGTITASRTPAGWTKAFSGTNKAAYKSSLFGATGGLLRVSDTAVTDSPPVRAYAAMTDVDTGTDPFPTVAQIADANSTWFKAGRWVLAASPSALFMGSDQTSGGVALRPLFFGDFPSLISGDAYNCALIAAHAATAPYYSLGKLDGTAGLNRYAMRLYDGTTKSAYLGCAGFPGQTYAGYGALFPYPAPVVGGAILAPIFLTDGTLRGRLPGIYHPCHNVPGAYGDTVSALISGVTRNLLLCDMFGAVGTIGRLALDVTGPWA